MNDEQTAGSGTPADDGLWLTGRRALVTGASRGIGLAVARAFAGAGADVVLVARPGPALEEAADEVRAYGAARAGTAGVVHAIAADLGLPGEAERVADAALAAGPVDILVNNAATVAPVGPSIALSPAEVASSVHLNVTAPMVLAFRLAGPMAERGWGRIVTVSSGVAADPASLIGGNVYSTSKAAIEMHSLNLAAELRGSGVTVNAYRPGMVDTGMQAWLRGQNPAEVGAELTGRFRSAHAEGRLLSPEHSAASLVRLLRGTETGQVWLVSAH